MKIVNLTEFLKLPENTVYSNYQPCIFTCISIKGPNCGEIDFYCTDIHPVPVECTGSEDMMNILDSAEKTQSNFTLDFDSGGRDGCYQEDQLFAIWSKDDIQRLIKRLNECL